MKYLKEGDKIDTRYGNMKVVEFKDHTNEDWFDIAETELLPEEAEADNKVDINDAVVINGNKYTVTDIEVQHFTDGEAYLQTYPVEKLDNAN